MVLVDPAFRRGPAGATVSRPNRPVSMDGGNYADGALSIPGRRRSEKSLPLAGSLRIAVSILPGGRAGARTHVSRRLAKASAKQERVDRV